MYCQSQLLIHTCLRSYLNLNYVLYKGLKKKERVGERPKRFPYAIFMRSGRNLSFVVFHWKEIEILGIAFIPVAMYQIQTVWLFQTLC